MHWDIFICHASEDKAFVRELAEALRKESLKVWYDEFSLNLGDSLRQSIDRGLSDSRFGIVILSKAFFTKKWTQYELNGLVQRDLEEKVILPIWHQIERQDLLRATPSLADKVAIRSTAPITQIVTAITSAMKLAEGSVLRNVDLPTGELEKPRLDLLRDLPTAVKTEDPPE